MTEKHRLGQALTKSDFKVYILILRAYQKYARIFYVKFWFFIKNCCKFSHRIGKSVKSR